MLQIGYAPTGSMLMPKPTSYAPTRTPRPMSYAPDPTSSATSSGLPSDHAPQATTIYTPPTNYSCTPGYCVQQMQALLNMAITSLGGSHIVAVNGIVGQDTVDSVIIMAHTGLSQFALIDVQPDINWVTTNAPSFVASLAAYLNIDPSSLLPPATTKPPPQVLCSDGSSVTDASLCPTYTAPTVVTCPDGSSASDPSLCPPTAGATGVVTQPDGAVPQAPPTLLPPGWFDGATQLVLDYWYIPAGLALLGGILMFTRRKRA